MKSDVTVLVEASVNIACAKCGKSLDASANGSEIDVEPCEKCLADAHEEGRAESESA